MVLSDGFVLYWIPYIGSGRRITVALLYTRKDAIEMKQHLSTLLHQYEALEIESRRIYRWTEKAQYEAMLNLERFMDRPPVKVTDSDNVD